jgi:hypothetical protein
VITIGQNFTADAVACRTQGSWQNRASKEYLQAMTSPTNYGFTHKCDFRLKRIYH